MAAVENTTLKCILFVFAVLLNCLSCSLIRATKQYNLEPVTDVDVQRLVKAKFHYAIQVADPVSDPVSHKFVRVCDQLATFLGRKQVADRFELRKYPDTRTWSQTGLQLAFDQLSSGLRHAHDTHKVCTQVGDHLDSVAVGLALQRL